MMCAIEKYRIYSIFHHLQHRLDEISPTQPDFLKYREEIIETGTNLDLQEILANEKDLFDERKLLIGRIQNERFNEKKKDFAVARAKLAVVDKKLKETTKHLNRRLLEGDFVVTNLRKLGDEINWMKQRLEETELEAVLGGDTMHDNLSGSIACSTTDIRPTLETTIQKKEKIVIQESVLCERIRELKDEKRNICEQELNLTSLRKKVKQLKEELEISKEGGDPDLLRRQRKVNADVDTTQKLHEEEQSLIKLQIGTCHLLLRNQSLPSWKRLILVFF